MSIDSLFSGIKAAEPGVPQQDNLFPIRKAFLDPALPLFASPNEKTLVRKKQTEKAAFIEKHSQLGEPTESIEIEHFDTLLPLLGQIYGDELIGGSPLEKLPLYVGADVLCRFLELVEEVKVPGSLISGLRQLHAMSKKLAGLPKEIEEAKKAHQEKINALKAERDLLSEQIRKINVAINAYERAISSKKHEIETQSKIAQPPYREGILAKLEGEIAELTKKINEQTQEKAPLLEKNAEKLKEINLLERVIIEAYPIHMFAQQLMKDIYELSEGESYFIEGGRVEESGIYHPVIFQFTKKEGKTYDLLVYLVGKEAGQYQTLLYKDGKTWLRPVVRYAAIPETYLFFNDNKQEIQSDFFQAILESTLPKKKKNIPAKFVALHLLGHLQIFRTVVPAEETSGFISAARSHSDSWRCVKAIVFHHLGKEAYKKAMAEIKLHTLIGAYQKAKEHLSNDTIEAERMRTILKAGAKHLLRALLLLDMQGSIEQEKLDKARATALDLIKKIKEAQKIVREARKKWVTPFSVDALVAEDDGKRLQEALELAKTKIITGKKGAQMLISAAPRSFTLPAPAELAATLAEYTELRDRSIDGSKVQKAEIEQLINLLPLPNEMGQSPYWDEVTTEDCKRVIISFDFLLETYDHVTRGTTAISPKEANTLFVLYALIHYTAVRIDQEKNPNGIHHPSSISYYPIYFPGILYDHDPYLLFTSPADFERRQETVAYFKGTYMRNPNLGYTYGTDDFGWEFVWKKRGNVPHPLFDFDYHPSFLCEKSHTNGYFPFFQALATTYPELQLHGAPCDNITCLMRHLSRGISDNRYEEAGLYYIRTLAYAAFMAHLFSAQSSLRVEKNGNFEVYLEYQSTGRHISYRQGNKEYQRGGRPSSLALHPPMSDQAKKWLSAYPWNNRIKRADTSFEEGEVLRDQEKMPLLRHACEPTLFLHKLLTYYLDDITLLEEPYQQTRFEISFFRSILIPASAPIVDLDTAQLSSTLSLFWTPYMRNVRFPLQEELRQGGFRQRCLLLIEEGIERTVYQQPKQRPNVFAALFFIRLAIRLNRFLPGSELYDPIPLLESLLKRSDLSSEERSGLSLHYVLGLGSHLQNLSSDQIEKLFAGWVFYKNTPVPEKWHAPLVEKEAKEVIVAAFSMLPSISQEAKKSILNQALQQFGIGSLPEVNTPEATEEPHCLKIAYGEGSFWEIDLVEGGLRNEQGILQRIQKPEWTKQAKFTTLFGKRECVFIQTGSSVYFTHSDYGTFRVIDNLFPNGLQRDLEGEWYQFIDPACLKGKLPSFLLADHTHWIPCRGEDGALCIYKKKTGEFVGSVTTDGKIAVGGHHVRAVSPHPVLRRIEKPEYIELTEESGVLVGLGFPRYISLSGEPLFFEIKDNAAIYKANKRYVISKNQKGGILGGIEEYILLKNKKRNKQKILVPLKTLQAYSPLTSQHALDVIDKHKSWKEEEEFATEQVGTFTYLEFDIVGGEVKPVSLEGTLFLVYIELTQRHYNKAKSLIDQVSFRENFSATSLSIMKSIIAFAESAQDPSPEAAAVALHTWLVGMQAQKRADVEKRSLAFHKEAGRPSEMVKIDAIVSCYRRHEHRLPTHLLLNTEQRAFLDRGEPPQLVDYPNPSGYHTFVEGQIAAGGKLNLPHPHERLGRSYGWVDPDKIRQNEYFVINQTRFMPKPGEKDFYSGYREPFFLSTSPYNSATLFMDAYNIAKCGSSGERSQLAFRLQIAGAAGNGNDEAWSYLQFAHENRLSAPDLPNYDSLEGRWEFIQRIRQNMEEVRKRDRRAITHTLMEARFDYEASEPSRPLIARILPPKKLQKTEHFLQIFIPEKAAIDQGFSAHLFGKHFTPLPKEDQASYTFTFDPEWVSEEEKIYAEAIEKEFADFFEDYEKGKQLNAKQVRYTVSDISGLKDSLERRIAYLEREAHDLKIVILELANQKADPRETFRQQIGIDKEITFPTLLKLFLSQDKRKFAEANPYLRDSRCIKHLAKSYGWNESEDLAIEYLYNSIALYLALSVERDRLQRAAGHCNDLAKPEISSSPTGRAIIQKLAHELKPLKKPTYLIREYPTLLLYEYLSHFTLRSEQTKVVRHFLEVDPKTGHFRNGVKKLMMGQGKTAVVGVIRLVVAALKRRLSLFIVPASQRSSVAYNLRKVLWNYFEIELEEIDVHREQLDLKMCQEIEERLTKLIARGNVLLMAPEALQAIELEFLNLAFEACMASRVSHDHMARLNSLRSILFMFRKDCDALIDEVDTIMNVLQEVNFPVGDEEHVLPDRIFLIREIFSIFVQENVSLDDGRRVNLRRLTGFQDNRQTLLKKSDLDGVLAQALARYLIHSVDALKLKDFPEFHQSFYRYISETMNITCQKMLDKPSDPLYDTWDASLSEDDRVDFRFLQYLKKLRYSGSREEEEAAHQIALVKLMLQEVFTATFKKVGKRNYGRGGEQPGGIRPYYAAGTPSTNLFGYHWETVTYHYLTAIQAHVEKSQLLAISKRFRKQAEFYARKEQKPVDETFEAQEFKRLTGVELYEIDLPGKLDEAYANLEGRLEEQLFLEAETASELVTFHPFRLTATGHSLARMTSTIAAMSGTGSVHCYDSRLSDNYKPTKGIEGQIFDLILSRLYAKKQGKAIHIIDYQKNLLPFFKALLEHHPNKKKVLQFMDSGALFKDFSNYQVAETLADYLGLPVLFFMRDEAKGEKTPDTLACVQPRTHVVTLIGGTRLEDIEKAGLNLGEYVVYDDDRHTTGTDIPLPSDAIGMMTVDETLLRTAFSQTEMRLRELFLEQNLEFIVPKYLENAFLKVGVEDPEIALFLGIIFSGTKEQAITESNHFLKSCRHAIDNAFRQALLNFLLPDAITPKKLADSAPFRSVILSSQKDMPYDQSGGLRYPVDTPESLKSYADRKLRDFIRGNPSQELVDNIEKELEAILARAADSPYLQKQVTENGSEDLGMQVNVLKETAAQVQQQSDQASLKQQEKELQEYRSLPKGDLRKEDDWKEATIEAFILQMLDGKKTFTPPAERAFAPETHGTFGIYQISDLFQKDHYVYKTDFTEVFENNILATETWVFTCKNPLPVFHPMQRWVEGQLIFLTKKGFLAVWLSQKETRQFKEYLQKRYLEDARLKDVWLVQANGVPFEDNPYCPLPQHQAVQLLLIQANAFNGTFSFLIQCEAETSVWLHKGTNWERRLDFLRLKACQDSEQKKLFFESRLFNKAVQNAGELHVRRVVKRCASLKKEEIQALTQNDRATLHALSPSQVNLCLPSQIPWLLPHQIVHLHERELIQAIPKDFVNRMHAGQLRDLASHQVEWFENSLLMTRAMPSSFIQHMSDRQLANLSDEQIEEIEDQAQLERLNNEQLGSVIGTQVEKGLIPIEKLQYLRKKSAIQAVPVTLLHHIPKRQRELHLSNEQILGLDAELQKQLIEELTSVQLALRPSPPPTVVLQSPPLPEINLELPVPPEVVIQAPPPPDLNPEESPPIEEVTVEPEPQAILPQPVPASPPRNPPPIITRLQPIPQPPPSSRCYKTTQAALRIFYLLATVSCIGIGAFAIIGGYSFAPQFMVSLANSLVSPYVAYGLTSGGIVGLVAYAIYICSRPYIHQRTLGKL
jgi:hypothetical protein